MKEKRHSNTYLQQAAEFLNDLDMLTEDEVRENQAERWRVLQTLRRFEAWRRGYGNTYPPVKQISYAIEYCIRELKSHFKE